VGSARRAHRCDRRRVLFLPDCDHEPNHVRGKQSCVRFIRSAKQPELPVILPEDPGALVGLVFALFGVSLTLLTGSGIWGALGTAMIGFLLVAIAAAGPAAAVRATAPAASGVPPAR
jgi:hypothetical protein